MGIGVLFSIGISPGMSTRACPICTRPLIKHGTTSSGRQRYRCTWCNATTTQDYDTTTRRLRRFLAYLMNPVGQQAQAVSARTFRRHNEPFWAYWPIAPAIDEIHPVIMLDGLYLNRRAVVLIAATPTAVLGWYLAQRERTSAYAHLLRKIAAPDMVIIDGGPGIRRAIAQVWPTTRIQRCIFHVQAQLMRATTQNPRLDAGKDLLHLARTLGSITSLAQADAWVNAYYAWLGTYDAFLAETSKHADGIERDRHQRLVTARDTLNRLIRTGHLFTYLDPTLVGTTPWPKTTSPLEGGINAQLRAMLYHHRGMRLTHQLKAISWWCYLHTKQPTPTANTLHTMLTDQDILNASTPTDHDTHPAGWGTYALYKELKTTRHYHP